MALLGPQNGSPFLQNGSPIVQSRHQRIRTADWRTAAANSAVALCSRCRPRVEKGGEEGGVFRGSRAGMPFSLDLFLGLQTNVIQGWGQMETLFICLQLLLQVAQAARQGRVQQLVLAGSQRLGMLPRIGARSRVTCHWSMSLSSTPIWSG